jgi:HEAT repeat protein
VSKRNLQNLIVVILIVAGVAALNSWQRGRRAESLAGDMTQADDYQAYKSMKKLAALGPGAMSKVVPLLGNENAYVRARAAMLIATTGAQEFALPVQALLSDPDAQPRMAAAVAAGRLGDRSAAERLAQLVATASEPMEVRIAAANSLAELGAPVAAMAGLKGALALPPTPENASLREAAMLALGTVPERDAVTEVAAHLTEAQEPEPGVRLLAARALAQAGLAGPEAMAQAGQALITALGDKDSEVRIAAAHSLTQMHFAGDMNTKVAEALKGAADDPHYWVREAASAQ